MKTLIVAPMSREARAIPRQVFVCGSGAAPRRVASAVEASSAEVVIIAGVCGGLDPSLTPGSLILARRLVAAGEAELTPSHVLLDAARRALIARNIGFVSSTLLTMDRPIASRDDRTAAWNEHGAAGVDMETFGVAKMLESRGVRWLALRSVVDPANDALPAPLLEWREEQDEREIVRRMLRAPASWPSLIRLALQMRSATRTLRRSVPPVAAALTALTEIKEPPTDTRQVQFISVQ